MLRLRLLVFNQFALQLVLDLFSANFRLEITDQIVALQQVVLEVALNLSRKLLWVFFALIKLVVKERGQFLVVVLRIFNICRPLRKIKASHSLVEEAGFFLSLRLSLLHILLLKISVMLLVHALLTELHAHICNTNIDICVELLRLD